MEESWASECRKIEFLKNEVIKYWGQNSNFWLKTMHETIIDLEIDEPWS